jgi:hypothetical protein
MTDLTHPGDMAELTWHERLEREVAERFFDHDMVAMREAMAQRTRDMEERNRRYELERPRRERVGRNRRAAWERLVRLKSRGNPLAEHLLAVIDGFDTEHYEITDGKDETVYQLDFATWRKRFLGMETYAHQQQWIDLLEGSGSIWATCTPRWCTSRATGVAC